MNEGQRKLVSGLHSTGPLRWLLRSAMTQHARMLREVMVQFMTETLTLKITQGGAEKATGLVVCPSSNMHLWWAAGWQGSAISSVQFMRSDAPDVFDCVLFDAQAQYPEKFIARLDTFLADPNAPVVVFWLPTLAEGYEPEWLEPLVAVLTKHRFVSLKID